MFTSTNYCCYFTVKRSPSQPLLNDVKKGKNSTKKNRSLLVHIVELSTAVVKVDIKVIYASLTQNQCLQCLTPSLMHVEIPRRRDATELNNDGMITLGDVYYQVEPRTDFIFFFEIDLINDNSSFCSPILSAMTCKLQCRVFLFEKPRSFIMPNM